MTPAHLISWGRDDSWDDEALVSVVPTALASIPQYSNVTNTCQIILTANKDIHASIGQTFQTGEKLGSGWNRNVIPSSSTLPPSTTGLTAEQSEPNL